MTRKSCLWPPLIILGRVKISDTVFTNGVTVTDSDWFNDVNRLHYTLFGDPTTATNLHDSVHAKGADVASATTTVLTATTGDYVHITGTTTITALTISSGDMRVLVFDGILTLTHNATSLILPGGANITTAAGDVAVFRGDGVGNVRCLVYSAAVAAPITAAGVTGFTTGDVKLTLKTTADSGWVLMNDGSIGNASSAATTRANADTVSLFTLLWTNTADAECPVSTGRGASAAADYAANKRITLPLALGRALACYGAGSGLTSRVLAKTVGTETHTLAVTEIPAHAHPGSSGSIGSGAFGGGGARGASETALIDSSTSVSVSVASQGGGGAHNNVQPTVFLNVMVKL